ncbi:MAG: EAL domain-containing protein [Nevskia sp.]|nr:EAL domain-containing protein [Nevskia sp.]
MNAAQRPAAADAAEEGAAAGLRPRVLCVDDERSVLDGLGRVLRRHCQVLVATSGAEGLNILQSEPDIAVVVSDMRMPEMDGATFLSRAREITPDAVRILLTGQTDIGSATAAINQGQIFRFLLKPCPPPQLIEAIATAAAQYRLVKEQRAALERQSAELTSRTGELESLRNYDALTGLANRHLFLQRLGAQMGDVGPSGQVCVLVLDIERFKYLNDSLGRTAGDEILRGVAKSLRQMPVEAQHMGRMSGSCFAMAIRGTAHGDALNLARQIVALDLLESPLHVAGRTLQLAPRYGLAMFPDDGGDAESLLRKAESAMKSAAADGERLRLYSPELETANAHRIRLEEYLRRAVAAEQLHLQYQPKVDLLTGTICGAEALLRWNCPELGPISPVEFVPLLEETGLIHQAGLWSLRRAAADFRGWAAAGLVPPPVAVNVTTPQLREPGFVDLVREAVCHGSDRAHGISLEITESTLMEDTEDAVQKLKYLGEMGIRTAIDDFGTGYSSLAYLATLPVAAVKVDRSFVARMRSGSDAIMSGVVSLAHSLGLRVVAEGVESREQVEFLRQLRCNEMQGFLFSPAVPAAEFAAMLQQGKSLLVD